MEIVRRLTATGASEEEIAAFEEFVAGLYEVGKD